ncbi:MAG: SUF system NifU family Fe-S cluster assembly protein [Patescibacteria group bacterium]|jgi:nitrogen fixation NifU-like protein
MTYDMYREIIIDHYKDPHNFGIIKDADKSANKKNPLCGDEMQITVKLDKKKKISDIKFTGAGCSVSRAGGSILTDIVKGKRISELKKYTDRQFIQDMGVPITPARKKCALLSLETLRKALNITKPSVK